MSIGILIRGQLARSVRMGHRLQALAQSRGLETHLRSLPDGWKKSDANSLRDWCRDLSTVIWIGHALRREVKLFRSAEKSTVAMLDWPGLPDTTQCCRGMRELQHIVCAGAAMSRIAGFAFNREVTCVPWDLGVMTTRRPPSRIDQPPRVCVLADGEEDSLSALCAASAILAHRKTSHVTMASLSRRILPSVRSQVARLYKLKTTSGRFRSVCGSGPLAMRAALIDSDMAILTGRGDGIGEACLEAQAAGCAVVCYDMPILNELVRTGYNGLLVKTGLVCGPYGTSYAAHNPTALAAAAVPVLQGCRSRLVGLAENAGFGFASRRSGWYRNWGALLGVQDAVET